MDTTAVSNLIMDKQMYQESSRKRPTCEQPLASKRTKFECPPAPLSRLSPDLKKQCLDTNSQESVRWHLKELSSRIAKFGECHRSVADILNVLGLICHHATSTQDQALFYHIEALRVLIECHGQETRQEACDKTRRNLHALTKEIAVTLTDIGNCYLKSEDSKNASQSYKEALRLFQIAGEFAKTTDNVFQDDERRTNQEKGLLA